MCRLRKKETQILKKNIGKIFRRYNIVEYKSPDDYLCIDDFYKGYAYTYFYKADRTPVNSILLEELPISFVCQNYPRELFRHIVGERKLQIEKVYAGIYYVIGDTLPIQIIVTGELSKKESLWLRNLTNQLKSTKDAEELLKDYKNIRKHIIRVCDGYYCAGKRRKFEEAKKMCKALEELMKDELEAKKTEGEEIGEERVNELTLKLSKLGRIEDIIKAASDRSYQERLFKEFGL
jgi:hypothetical protein